MKHQYLSQLAHRTVDPPISWLMKLALENPNLISLAAGFTDSESLPLNEVREAVESILSEKKKGRQVLQYGAAAGDEKLRQLTMKGLEALDHSGEVRRCAYEWERTVMTHGSQQALYLVTEALCDAGDIVLVEDPTYFVYLGTLASHGVQTRGVAADADGIDLEALERVLSRLEKEGNLARVKMLYLITYFHNPTGVTTSLEKKRGALEILRRFEKKAGHRIFLLEDAAYRELRFAGEDVASALSIGGSEGRVIYAGTYSKPFATGVRIGYVSLPEPLLTVVKRIKGNHDFGTSNLLQQVVLHALESGLYERHLPAMRQRYRKKAAVMKGALKEHFPAAVSWREPAGGMYFWAKLPKKISTGVQSPLFRQSYKRNVLYVPGAFCYAPDVTRRPAQNEMRLSFGSASEMEIEEGIRKLGQVIGGLLK